MWIQIMWVSWAYLPGIYYTDNMVNSSPSLLHISVTMNACQAVMDPYWNK